MGFIEEVDAIRVSPLSPDERRALVIADLACYFGEPAAQPLEYREKNWGEDPFCRGVDGGLLACGGLDQLRPCARAAGRVPLLGQHGDRGGLEREDGRSAAGR